MRAVSDEMVLTLSAAGTADDVAARISALLKAGLKQAVLFPLAVDGGASGAIPGSAQGTRTARRGAHGGVFSPRPTAHLQALFLRLKLASNNSSN